MARIAALILTEDIQGAAGDITIAGLNLAERAVLAVHRAGIDRMNVVGERPPEPEVLQRLRRRGLDVTFTCPQGQPFETAPQADLLVVLTATTIAEPRAITSLVEHARLRPGEAAFAIDSRSDAQHRLADVSNGTIHAVLADGHVASTGLAVFTPEAVELVRQARSSTEALQKLARAGGLRAVSPEPHFCERLYSIADRADVEHRYIRHLNGDEFWFTKVLRRQSVYLTRALVHTPLSPNQVTILGLLIAVPAAYGFALGGYWPAVAGGLLYYFSTLLDCSDGEMARCTFRGSVFGCWLETVSDYASTILMLVGTLMHVVTNASRGDMRAVWVAGIGTTFTMALLAYQRWRMTHEDPDGFERMLHGRLGEGHAGLMGRFVVWGSQYIKRACLAHVLLFLAMIGQLRVLVYLWAFAMLVTVPLLIGVHAALMGWEVPFLRQRGASIGNGDVR